MARAKRMPAWVEGALLAFAADALSEWR